MDKCFKTEGGRVTGRMATFGHPLQGLTDYSPYQKHPKTPENPRILHTTGECMSQVKLIERTAFEKVFADSGVSIYLTDTASFSTDFRNITAFVISLTVPMSSITIS
ncbi:hypothetical protein O181_111494 [Austropuccinia psidii MF-1]|uniref:Uncharacterized protein n=1 Tax=Austropuccinia psidii MF-1 TaxID=1389203 RepID=A0A9Q3K236_9BASI|nr:hypothetical protein [Austropuccinia psidii MF-1]